QPDVAGKRARNREHLLLSTRQGHTFLVASILEAGKMFVDLLERPAARLGDLRELQVILDRQTRDDTPVLLDDLYALARRLKILEIVDRLALQPDLAPP